MVTSLYLTTYCNFGHCTKTGKPVDHECRNIPPAALQAEREGDFEKAIEIMNGKKRRNRR